jgi:hypothetical protein
MNSIKKTCINSSKHFYTGNELSPLHFGLSAEGYELNSVIEGYDKELWVVDIKNSKKVWVKNDTIIRITREDPVINSVEPTLLKKMHNEYIIDVMNMNNLVCEKNKNGLNENEENHIVNKGAIQKTNVENLNILKNKKTTDYNLFVKYRLNQLNDSNKTKKDNFNDVKKEWNEVKKDKANLGIIMSNAKAWYAKFINDILI